MFVDDNDNTIIWKRIYIECWGEPELCMFSGNEQHGKKLSWRESLKQRETRMAPKIVYPDPKKGTKLDLCQKSKCLYSHATCLSGKRAHLVTAIAAKNENLIMRLIIKNPFLCSTLNAPFKIATNARIHDYDGKLLENEMVFGEYDELLVNDDGIQVGHVGQFVGGEELAAAKSPLSYLHDSDWPSTRFRTWLEQVQQS